MSLPVEAVEAILKTYNDENGWDDVWDTWTYAQNEDVEVAGLGRVQVIDVHELSEGDWGGDQWIIFRVTDEHGDVRHYKKEGHYESYAYDDCWDRHPFYEVTPKKEWVPAYERVTYA